MHIHGYSRYMLLPVLGALLLFTACTSPEKRIRKNQAVFDRFPPEAQERIRRGEIALGDSPNMVQIAKGVPTYITIRETQQSEIEVWRWTRMAQTVYSQPVHYNGRGVPSPQILDIPQVREIEILRVEFLNDSAVVIEETKDSASR